jgi:hypothetical protein
MKRGDVLSQPGASARRKTPGIKKKLHPKTTQNGAN